MNVSYLNMAHALSSDQAPFNRRLESCKQVSDVVVPIDERLD